ncbi:ROK family protein [Patescibacteria group bacterium]|nr:ROK family protein [Patescibacteria group bacterium]
MYISLDIGATNTRMAASQSLDDVQLTAKTIFPTNQFFESGISEIIIKIKKISEHPEAIGIGIAGRVSEGELEASTNLPDWVNKKLVKRLNNEFDCPVYIANDAVAQGLAEVYFGHGLKEKFLYLVLGTGLGGAIVDGQSKKAGSIKFDREFLRTWEQKFGGKNIKNIFGKSAENLSDSQWQIVTDDFSDCIKDLSSRVSVKYIILSGGMIDKQKDRFVRALSNIQKPKILFSDLRDDIGLYGSLALIKK